MLQKIKRFLPSSYSDMDHWIWEAYFLASESWYIDTRKSKHKIFNLTEAEKKNSMPYLWFCNFFYRFIFFLLYFYFIKANIMMNFWVVYEIGCRERRKVFKKNHATLQWEEKNLFMISSTISLDFVIIYILNKIKFCIISLATWCESYISELKHVYG